ncbi:MAG: beta-xylosidase [Candidatus Latescibacterota bacterium]
MKIALSAKQSGRSLNPYWNMCVGAGRANEGLRANWLEHLALAVEECGFRYVRFHGLFHDDMFVYREDERQARYNWQYIDELFDRLLDIGVRPYVELGFCPKDLASDDETIFWWKGGISPPADNGKWGDLIEGFTRHCISRYGSEEVRSWYFEVWNEPNLSLFWSGTKAQYFELYKVTVLAIKRVDPELRVGGPATSNFVPDDRFAGEREDTSLQRTLLVEDLGTLDWRGVWIEDFLSFCHREALPVDFVSAHPYPTDFALDTRGDSQGRSRPVDSTLRDTCWLRDVVSKSAYPDAEIHLSEWSCSPTPRDHSHDYLQAAAYVVKTNLDGIGLTQCLTYWTFTDVFEETGAGAGIFHGGFGLINFQGIVKPTFHAYRFLNGLGDEELVREEGGIVTRNSQEGRLSALLYHYPAELRDTIPMSVGSREVAEQVLAQGTPKTFALTLSDLQPGAPFELETLDARHGFAFKCWEQMGCPEPPTARQTALLRESAWDTKREVIRADASGNLMWTRTLDPWTVVAIRQIG